MRASSICMRYFSAAARAAPAKSEPCDAKITPREMVTITPLPLLSRVAERAACSPASLRPDAWNQDWQLGGNLPYAARLFSVGRPGN